MSRQGGGSRAVFVDPSGRRGRTVRRVTWTLGALVGAYAVLVVVALVVPVGMNRLTLPGLGPLLPGPVAPAFADQPADPVPPAPSSTPTVAATQSPAAVPRGERSPVPTQAPTSAVPVAEPAPAPVPAAPVETAAPGSSDTAPGRAADKPGNAPTAHPEPASTHAANPNPRPTTG